MSNRIKALYDALGVSETSLSSQLMDGTSLAILLRHRRMSAWLGQEMRGYAAETELPPHRAQVSGVLLAKMPQYGWILAPISEAQHAELAILPLRESIDALELQAATMRAGGERQELPEQRQLEVRALARLSAPLAVALPRDRLQAVVAVTRQALRLWAEALLAQDVDLSLGGGRFDDAAREATADLDKPERYLLRAQTDVAAAPKSDAKSGGLLSRLLGGA